MTLQAQEETKKKYYSEAMRYMANAKECLQKAKKEGKYYNDQKYVKMACGTAYNGLLVALDCFFILKDVEMPKGKNRKSIEFYHDNLAKLDKKLLNTLNSAYKILHLWGYYDGIENVSVVNDGLKDAKTLIDKIKPAEYMVKLNTRQSHQQLQTTLTADQIEVAQLQEKISNS
jgi:hypothetical protein